MNQVLTWLHGSPVPGTSHRTHDCITCAGVIKVLHQRTEKWEIARWV